MDVLCTDRHSTEHAAPLGRAPIKPLKFEAIG